MLFVLSTGRAGSRTIANVLSQSPDMVCLHEPLPQLVRELAEFRYGDLAGDELAEMLRESRPDTIDGRRYGESANRLSLAAPILASTFPAAQFVWLVRDGREVVSSGLQRGWHAGTSDTLWETWRLRGDRLGEVPESDWADWTPFRRGCWSWRRTNEIIRDDLADMDESRRFLLRLEDLNAQIGSVADYLGVRSVEWSIGRHNARASAPRVGESTDNIVDRRLTWEDWSEEEQSIFLEECGPLMDDLYPGWEAPKDEDDPAETPSSTGHPPPTIDVLADLADLRVMRGEMKALSGYVLRVDRRYEAAMASRDAAAARADKKITELQARLASAEAQARTAEARADDAHAELADVTGRLTVSEERLSAAQQELDVSQTELESILGSESFLLGHRLVRTVTAPLRVVRRLRAEARRRVKRIRKRSIPAARKRGNRLARRAVMKASSQPTLVRLGGYLPEPVTSRVVKVMKPFAGLGPAGNKKRSGAAGHHVPKLGLAVVADPAAVGGAWTTGVDVHRPADDLTALTHIDVVLTSGDPDPGTALVLADRPDTIHVRTGDRLDPVPAGLTPLGFGREHGGRLVAISTAAGEVSPPSPGLPGRAIDLRPLAALPDPLEDPHDFRVEMQHYLALVDDPTLHDHPARRAQVLLGASAVGLPVVVRDTTGLDGLVPAEIIEAWTGFDPRLLTREHDREFLSFRQRAAVHDHASVRARYDALLVDGGRPGLPTPSLSILVATNRPDLGPHWSRQIAAQDHPDFEVVWAQHGDRFEADHEAVVRDVLADRLQIVRVPDEHTLGDALNAATARASGEVLVKWDDDDLYDTGHLRDLARARQYSGAELVGKAAEFVYLQGTDVTIRRISNSTESYSTTIGGPTISIGRGDLRDIGGWRRTRRRVDQLLIDDVRAAGGSAYRTSGFGFIMVRTGSTGHAHTWKVGDDYFLSTSIAQRSGLDLSFAAVRSPDGLLDGIDG